MRQVAGVDIDGVLRGKIMAKCAATRLVSLTGQIEVPRLLQGVTAAVRLLLSAYRGDQQQPP